MKILIPTAKELNKKAAEKDKIELSEKTKEIIRVFAGKTEEELAKIYKIKIDKASEEYQRWQKLAIGEAKSYEALDLFNGLMYRNIGRSNFDEVDTRYIQNNVFITTSLYGVINAFDIIQEHRLDFLQNVKINEKSLKNFWREDYDKTIKDEDFVISLLSSEFEEIFSKDVRTKFVKINFMEEKDGKIKTHSTISKKARGIFLTELVKRKIVNLENIKEIKFDGFEYIAELSEDKVFAFVAKR